LKSVVFCVVLVVSQTFSRNICLHLYEAIPKTGLTYTFNLKMEAICPFETLDSPNYQKTVLFVVNDV
jgi:hypothetical protein